MIGRISISFCLGVYLCLSTASSAQTRGEEKEKGLLRHEAIIDAPVAEVWKAFTTADGLKSWMAPEASIDLRVGGKMLANYRAEGKLGDENTIENTILSFELQRMLSIQATKPPAGFPFASAIKDTWSVMYFEPVGADRTRIVICGMGYKDDAESTKMREFFDKGNAHTLEQLRKKFSRDAGTGEGDALKVLHRLVGGEWTFENKRDGGGVFRGRSVTEEGPDSNTLVSKGWLGDAGGMYYHAATQIWRDPNSKRVRFQSLDENGALASGEITSKSDDSVSWDWNMATLDGRKARYRVEMVFSDSDHYEFTLYEVKPEKADVERVRVKHARVAQAPEEFRKLKASKK